MFAAVSNVAPSLLMDGRLFDFRSLRAGETGQGHEDAWLDEDGV
jgi:tRNA 2-thiocytidine biosynthesis protein TtcA